MNTSTPILRLSVAVALSASLALAAPANAKTNTKMSKGDCSATSDWKMMAKSKDGSIRVTGIVKSKTGGQTWTWSVYQNDTLSASGEGTTKSSKKVFRVRESVANTEGTDALAFEAINIESGETCSGSLMK